MHGNVKRKNNNKKEIQNRFKMSKKRKRQECINNMKRCQKCCLGSQNRALNRLISSALYLFDQNIVKLCDLIKISVVECHLFL